MVKRMYFFNGSSCFEYDPRPGTDRVVKGPTPIATRFKGFNAAFGAGIDCLNRQIDNTLFCPA